MKGKFKHEVEINMASKSMGAICWAQPEKMHFNVCKLDILNKPQSFAQFEQRNCQFMHLDLENNLSIVTFYQLAKDRKVILIRF